MDHIVFLLYHAINREIVKERKLKSDDIFTWRLYFVREAVRRSR